MTPPESSCNELARWLAELESLGLARPATASIAEYLEAVRFRRRDRCRNTPTLVARPTIDCATPVWLRTNSKCAKHPTVSGRRSQVLRPAPMRNEGSYCGADSATTRDRQLRRQLQPGTKESEFSDLRPVSILATSQRAGTHPANLPAARRHRRISGPSPNPETKQSKRRREIRISSVPLETATLVVVGLVVAGYILRGGTDQAVSPSGAKRADRSGRRSFAADVWRNDDYWAAQFATAGADRSRPQSEKYGQSWLGNADWRNSEGRRRSQ